MGKRRHSGRTPVLEPSSEENSRQGTPAASDSEGSEATPPKKKVKEDASKKAVQGPKSSEELSQQFGLVHVGLEYTEADYQNLTNYGLFVRMVRPQVQGANPNISSSKLAQLMEAKWREFREGNPFTKKRREDEEKKKEEEKRKREEEDAKKEEKKKKKEAKKMEKQKQKEVEEAKRQAKDHVIDSEPDDEELDEEDEENGVDPESDHSGHTSRRASKGRRSGGGSSLMTVRLPLPKSAKKGRKSGAYESEEDATPKRSRGRNSKSPRIEESDEEIEEEDSEPAPAKKSRKKAKKQYVEEMEEDEPTARRSGRAARKKKMPDYTVGLSDEEEDSEPAKKSKKSKRDQSDEEFEESQGSSDEEIEEEEEDDMEDDDADSEDEEEDQPKRKKKKQKKKRAEPEKVRIPGERKSERSRKAVTSAKPLMSDREFEKMIALDAAAEKKKKEKKMEKKKKMSETEKRKKANEEKKQRFFDKQKRKENGEDVDEDEDSGNESDHCFYCEICHDAGDLLLCDKCPRSWHQACLKLENIPEGEWVCPKCTGDMESEEEDTGHEAFCRVCKDGGDVILCDTCICVFHMHCLIPPLTEVPEGEWRCPRCLALETPLKGWVQTIITWKWSHHEKGFDELDHTHSPTKKVTNKLRQEVEDEKNETNQKNGKDVPKGRPQRLLFVRFRDYSYWECDWITELQLEMFHPVTHSAFCRKWDMDEPPALEDGTSFGKRRRHSSKQESDDPYNLEERFYKWGVKPEYLQVDRVINHDRRKMYLVKWRELGYEEATWENAANIHPGVEDWQKKVDRYWSRRKEHLKEDKGRDKGPKPKKSALKKKLEKQPEYVDATGCTLHPYQLEGLNWLRFSWAQDTNTILADEMGLGKTIQAISFLYSLWKEGYSKGPFLLSVPLSTLLNWEREFALWAPDMYVVTYIGSKDARPIIREHEFSYKEGAFHNLNKPGRFREGFKVKFDVLLTSYEYVSMDYATLSSINWAVLVIDEAHRLKSQQSLFFRTLSQYKIDYILLLTGTPLQNNLEELFNLLNFLEKDKFGDMEEFLSVFTDISKDDQVAKLHEMLAPHMLRRLKIDVFKDLPSKTELIVRVELSPLQKKYYKHILTKNFEALNVKGHSNQTSLINIMMDLRKCCNHPYLFPAAETEAPITPAGNFEGNALIKASGKLEILSKMLKHLRVQNHRVLVFSQMTRVLDILEDFLVHEKLQYERIDGSVMGKHRQQSIDRFNSDNSDSFVFLLSTKAGGLGINLATADTVIIFDMDWNPHNDIQAFSRAHRIGQKNKVLIYRFVCRNTVEERMTQVCKQKMMLTELVIHRGMASANKEKSESITKKEVNDILKFGAEKLFKDDEEGKVTYDDETILRLLDRDQELDNKADDSSEQASFGMNDYLRSFKVASYNVKETAEEEEEEEEKEKEEEAPLEEEDPAYWQRVLGSAYEEHSLQLLREQEELANSLGKGKRTRRKVNYAEALQEQKRLAKEERRRQKEMRDKEEDGIMEEEVEDREDVLYMSDYEPDSTDHSDESSGNEEEVQEAEVLKDMPQKKQRQLSKAERARLRQDEREREKEREQKEKEKKMPPLLARVGGQVEVLGYTPRQRRAFMDAVMRYGLPMEDIYKSQWLVRDLRRKPEKVFKAYVSLFMRHLCEPIADDADKFADGIPREGLSRQHVLTRIGMMSLIRRKVHSFEINNSTDSFTDFGIKIIVGGTKAELVMPQAAKSSTESSRENSVDKEANRTDDKEKSVEREKADDKEKSVEREKADDKEKSVEREKADDKEKSVEREKADDKEKSAEREKADDKEKSVEREKADDKEKSNDSEKSDDKEQSDDKKKSEEKEESENKEETSSKDEADSKKKSDDPEKSEDGQKKEESEKSEESEPKEKESVAKEESDSKKSKESEESDDTKSDKEKEGEDKVKEEPMDDATTEAKDKDGETSEVKEEPDKETKDKDEDMEVDGKDKDDKKDSSEKSADKSEEDAKAEEKSEKTIKEEVKDGEGENGKKDEKKDEDGKKDEAMEVDGEEKSKSDEKKDGEEDKSKSKDGEKKEGKEEDAKETKTEKKEKKEKTRVEKAIDERMARQKRLRKKFYIADGGFTDLQNLWNYEENLMKDQKEYEVWHRHHDFWLLTGIVTHGYRHWQDILNDPRFEALNRAFRNDSDKMRKGAFLNRRFQLLEQALVIEEQLMRELRENSNLLKLLPERKEEDDQYTQIDQLAEVLRKLIKDGHIPAGTDPVLIKILMQIENLVGDIRQSTYSGMPSTIAKSPAQMQSNIRSPSVPGTGYPRGTVAAQIQQQQQLKSRQIAEQARKQAVRDALTAKTPDGQRRKGGNIICID